MDNTRIDTTTGIVGKFGDLGPSTMIICIDYVFSEDASTSSEDFIPCDEGWFYFRDKCYKAVGRNALDKKTWVEAEDICKNYDGSLVSIHSQEEYDFILTFFLMDFKEDVWIGLNDKAESRTFVWNDGSPNNYTNWDLGEIEVDFDDENCVVMRYGTDYERNVRFNAWTCSLYACGYICQKNINTKKESPNPLHCFSKDKRGVKFQNSCYHVVTEQESWKNAEQHCEANFDGHLVTILDASVDEFLDYLLLSNNSKYIWIGIDSHEETEPEWITGRYLSYTGLSATDGQNEGSKGYCSIRKVKKDWSLVPCAQNYSFVCERSEGYVFSEDASNSSDDFIPCDEGWYYFREKCYKSVGFVESICDRDEISWVDAEMSCKKYGGSLVSIHSHEEKNFIMIFFLMARKINMWIGLRDRSKNGTSVWNDGSPSIYTKWNIGKSGDERIFNGKNCVFMQFDPNNDVYGLFKFWACNGYNCGYICQKNINTKKETPNPMSCFSKGRRGVKFRSSCYHVVKEKETWENAEHHCETNFDGHLVTILDSSADMLLDYLLFNPSRVPVIWIGVFLHGETGKLQWNTGLYVFYSGLIETDWTKIKSKGYCVIRTAMKEWSLVSCTQKYPFVCERLEVIPPKSPPNSHCPEELYSWQDYGGGYCYHFENLLRLSWFKAKLFCWRKGGHLVSIHSTEEKDVLLPFVVSQNDSVHLGLHRHLTKEFVWEDGSKRDYDNWSEGQPSNDPEQKCTVMNNHDGSWSLNDCDTLLSFICSVRKVIQNATKMEETTDITVIQSATKMEETAGTTVIQIATKMEETTDTTGELKVGIGVTVGIVLVLLLLGLTVHFFRQWMSERRKNSTPIPPPIWTIPSRNLEPDYEYNYIDDGNYESMMLERRRNSTPVGVTPPPIWTIPSRNLETDDGYIYRDNGDYESMMLERHTNPKPARVTPTPIRTIPSRNMETDDGYIYKNDGSYKNMMMERQNTSTAIRVTPPPIWTIPSRNLDTDKSYENIMLEQRRNSVPVRVTPPPIWKIPSRNMESQYGYVHRDDGDYESMTLERRRNPTYVRVIPPPIRTIPSRNLETEDGYIYKDDGNYEIMQ